MELTKEQVDIVNAYLDSINLNYADIRLEVLDHIFSDIESLMITEHLDFESSFFKVKSKWKSQLQETSSFYFGIMFTAPKLVIQKAKKLFIKNYFFLPFFTFLPFLIMSHIDVYIRIEKYSLMSFVLKGVSLSSFLFFIYLILTKNNSVKTTYSFILKTQSLSALFGLFVIFQTFSSNKNLDGITIGMFTYFLCSLFLYYSFYKKHNNYIAGIRMS